MLMQHIGVGYFGYYRATAYAMKHSLMPEIAKLRMKALNFWDKHGIRAAADAFDVSTRTLYWWRRLLRTGGPEALIPRSKAPLVRRSRHWHPDVLKEIRRLRTELPNLGKEQIFVRLKPWCEARHFTCPSTSTIGRIIAGAHDKMRMIPVRLSARGKARLIKKRSVKPRRPKQYRPVKTGELIGMDAIELRMGDLRRYIITMIDEHSDYALALAVPSLNSDITSHFFSKATKLFPVAIRQVVTDNGKEFLGNFDKTLQEASIKHIWTYPYTPKMNATCERFNRTLREQFIEFNELLLFEDLNLFNQRMAEYLVLYNSKRPHKSLELMTPVDYILRESKNCNMWWTHTDYDIFLTDNPSNLTASGLLLSDDESGVREIGPGQLCVNFNMSNAMQEAVLQLIEVQLAQEEVTESPLGGDENAQLHASGYYALFVDTVPDDVKRLYTEAATSDFAALAQTAHRLKGVFAMLNLVPGKQLCETLEHLIREKDVPGIEKYISDIDSYVKSLL